MIYTYIVNIYHTTLHPMQCCLINNSKFQGSTTLQQTLSNITHKSSLLTLKINPRTPNSCTHWYKSLYQWWYDQTFAFYESHSKTRFYYYFLSFLFKYVQYYYYHYHCGVILLSINIIVIIHIIIVIMDIIYAYFNVSWYHVVSLKLLQQFTFLWLLTEIFRKKCLKVNKKLIIIILLLILLSYWILNIIVNL